MMRRTCVFLAIAVLFETAVTATAVNSCDLNSDGTVNVVDVQLAVNMSLGVTACGANIEGAGVCNSDVVMRVVNAALGGSCVTGVGGTNTHSVSLSWTASISPNIAGYNVYRAAVSGGPYAKVTPALAGGIAFVDTSVQAGQTYYYVATAVDNTGTESPYSTETLASVPTP
jgi:hypothetical protein